MATLKDIAQRTGMAVSSVSDILNNRTNVKYSESARERVQAAAADLGYLPNRLARGLLRGKTAMIGILVPDISNAFYSTILKHASAPLRAAGYTLLMDETPTEDGRNEAKGLAQLAGFRIDGLLACLAFGDVHETFLRNFSKSNAVAVSGLPLNSDLDVDAIGIDFGPGVESVANYLVGEGHRDFAFVGNHPTDKKLGRRWELLNKAFAQNGINGQPAHAIPCEHNSAGAREAFGKFLASCDPSKRPTAVIGLNDELAIGAMRAARDIGMRVPEDVSIVGFDNTPLGESLPIALTSVGVDLEAYGKCLADSLLQRLEGTPPKKPLRRNYAVELYVRETTGPAPGR